MYNLTKKVMLVYVLSWIWTRQARKHQTHRTAR